jgi:hypothetical protein
MSGRPRVERVFLLTQDAFHHGLPCPERQAEYLIARRLIRGNSGKRGIDAQAAFGNLKFAYRGTPEHYPLVLPRRPRYTSPESMPKSRKPRPRGPQPVELPLFAETASLVRIRPEHHE